MALRGKIKKSFWFKDEPWDEDTQDLPVLARVDEKLFVQGYWYIVEHEDYREWMFGLSECDESLEASDIWEWCFIVDLM